MPLLALNCQRTIMPLNDFVSDIQANSKTRVGFLFWITNTMEAIKNVIEVLFLNPNAKQSVSAVGADDFMAKPFDMDELLATIAKYC